MSVQSSQKLNLDSTQERVFIKFFRQLEEKSPSTVQFFCRGDYYTLHGPDAVFAAKEVFKSTSVLKQMNSEDSRRPLEYVVLSKLNFEAFVRDLLLVKNYRVEVYICSKNVGEWTLDYKASPGNLTQFEDLLFGEGSVALRGEPLAGVIAVRTMTTDSKHKMVGVGFVDGTQRRMLVSEFPDSESLANLEATILQLGPRELLLPISGDKEEYAAVKEVAERCGLLVTERKRAEFNADEGFIQDLGRLLYFTEGQSDNVNLLDEIILTHATPCLAACIRFLELINDSLNFGKFDLGQYDSAQYVRVDGTTVRAVNLKPSFNTSGIGKPSESLLGLLGQNVKTQQGLRLLSRWLQQPLRDVARLEERLDVVEALSADPLAMEALSKDYLTGVPDLQALARKIQRKKATLHDLFRIYQGIQRLGGVVTSLEGLAVEGQTQASVKSLLLDPLREFIKDMQGCLKMIESTMDIDQASEGIYRILPSFDERLNELHEMIEEFKQNMQRSLAKAAKDLHLEAGKNLKLESNPQLGYFFRVTLKDEKVLRGQSHYETLDTNKSGVRFTDPKLRVLNQDHNSACTEYEEQQTAVVSEMIEIAGSYVSVLCKLSDVLAHVDVLNSFAMAANASKNSYVRPKLLPAGSGVMKFTELRHPCVERIETIEFVPNDLDLEEETRRMMILTGPNMGGKSTYIRSVGAAVIMAQVSFRGMQVGSFVPADHVELSLVDAVLARVGAGDCQARGISTFMAEMLETSAILRAATKNSLVIIDELGRGTSTYDGFGLAWAISHHIVSNVRAFCLFATHFHELTVLSQATDGVVNFHVTAETSEGHLLLLHRVQPGSSDQSFGLHVAKMVDFPDDVLRNAARQQKLLELQHKLVPSQLQTISVDDKRKEAEAVLNKFFADVALLEQQTPDDAALWREFERLRADVMASDNPYVAEMLNNVPQTLEQVEAMEC